MPSLFCDGGKVIFMCREGDRRHKRDFIEGVIESPIKFIWLMDDGGGYVV